MVDAEVKLCTDIDTNASRLFEKLCIRENISELFQIVFIDLNIINPQSVDEYQSIPVNIKQ